MFFRSELVFLALEALSDLLVMNVQPRHDLENGSLFLATRPQSSSFTLEESCLLVLAHVRTKDQAPLLPKEGHQQMDNTGDLHRPSDSSRTALH